MAELVTNRGRQKAGHKSRALTERLRKRIVSGVLAAGQRLPTREALSAELEVSLDTVQAVMQTLEEDRFIRSRGRAGTFVSPHPPHLYDFALVFLSPAPASAASIYWRALAEAAGRFEPEGPRRIHVFDQVEIHEDCEPYVRLRSWVERHLVGGLIFPTPPNELEHTPIVLEPDIPRAAIMRDKVLPGIANVALDHPAYLRRAIEHLARCGCRRVATISYFLPVPGLDVLAAELARHGMSTRPAWMQAPALSFAAARHCALSLFERPAAERPDGLLILDDHFVEGATDGLATAGVTGEGDVAVVAHANFPLVSPSRVRAARLGWDAGEILAAAVDLLQGARFAGGNASPPSVNLEPRWQDA